MSTGTSLPKVDVLVASPREDFWKEIQSILAGFESYTLHRFASVDDILENSAGLTPRLALIDGLEGTAMASEWSQATRMTYGTCPILVLHNSTIAIDFATLKKNGTSEIMHIGYDKEFISDMVLQMAPIPLEGENIPVSALMPVDLRDMDFESEINFDLFIHLPSNHKTILFRKTGSTLEEKTIGKFADQKQNMYVKKTQMKEFFEYARTVQSSRDAQVPVSMTEKFHRSKKSIFMIMSNFMDGTGSDLAEGRRILAECENIIEVLELTKKRSPVDINSEIGRYAGNLRTNYHDAISVAAYSAFFAQALDWTEDQIKGAALAGLLHNIGLVQAPFGSATYDHYPERSVNMVKEKKVSLSVEISAAIAQHRELGDGTGFPTKIPNEDMKPLSRLLVIAYNFHEMTALQNMQKAHTALASLKLLKDNILEGDGRFDIMLINQLYAALGKAKA